MKMKDFISAQERCNFKSKSRRMLENISFSLIVIILTYSLLYMGWS